MLRNRKKYFPFLATVTVFPDLGNKEKISSAIVTSKYWPPPLWIPVAILTKCCFPFLMAASGGIPAYLNQKVNIKQESAHLKVQQCFRCILRWDTVRSDTTRDEVFPHGMYLVPWKSCATAGRCVNHPGGLSMGPAARFLPSSSLRYLTHHMLQINMSEDAFSFAREIQQRWTFVA